LIHFITHFIKNKTRMFKMHVILDTEERYSN